MAYAEMELRRGGADAAPRALHCLAWLGGGALDSQPYKCALINACILHLWPGPWVNLDVCAQRGEALAVESLQRLPPDTAGAIACCDCRHESTWFVNLVLSKTRDTISQRQVLCTDAGRRPGARPGRSCRRRRRSSCSRLGAACRTGWAMSWAAPRSAPPLERPPAQVRHVKETQHVSVTGRTVHVQVGRSFAPRHGLPVPTIRRVSHSPSALVPAGSLKPYNLNPEQDSTSRRWRGAGCRRWSPRRRCWRSCFPLPPQGWCPAAPPPACATPRSSTRRWRPDVNN